MTSHFTDMTSSPIFLMVFVYLVKFSQRPTFHVNIITRSGVMAILFYEGLTINPEIGNTPSEFAQNLETGAN